MKRGRARDVERGYLHGRIDRNAWILAQDMVEPGRMIVVAMRDDDEVEILEIDAKGVDVVDKVRGFRACIKKHAPATIFDERGISPSSLEVRGLSERIVEDGDSGRWSLCRGSCGSKWRKQRGSRTCKQAATRDHVRASLGIAQGARIRVATQRSRPEYTVSIKLKASGLPMTAALPVQHGREFGTSRFKRQLNRQATASGGQLQ
jgi:hypothetical protein